MTKSYYRVMLGEKSKHFEEMFAANCIGAGFIYGVDLTKKLPDQWRTFNKEFIPVYLKRLPEKSKIGAGLACGALWTVCKGMKIGDVVLCPDGTGHYQVGEITGDYFYVPGPDLCHRRPVKWHSSKISKESMSEALRNSAGSIGTVSNITQHQNEIELLMGVGQVPTLVSTDATVEDVSSFALEAHLEEFLVKNWAHTELGKEFEIYEEDGIKAQQYQTDTGPLDILAISKDKKQLLVVELKKGRASDVVVGQTLRYMSYVHDELAEAGQTVRGMIIAHEDDQKIRRALSMTTNISFYRYQVSFKLVKD